MTHQPTAAQPRGGRLPPDRFTGLPSLVAGAIGFFSFGLIVVGSIANQFGISIAGLVVAVIAVPFAAIAWAVALLVTAINGHWRHGLSVLGAGLAFIAAGVVSVLSEQALRIPLWTVSIPSPSGRYVVEKRFFNDEGWYAVFVATPGLFWRRSDQLVSRRTSGGFGTAGDLSAAWQGDRHLMIGWPVGTPPVSGPEKVGGIAVTYAAYHANPADDAAKDWHEIPFRDVIFSFREEEEVKSSTRKCIVRVAGTDGAVFDRVGVEILGEGRGVKADRPMSIGRVNSMFSLARLPDGRSPELTLTQAMVGSVFPTEMSDSGPQKADLSLHYLAYTVGEVARLFETMRRRDFLLRFVLSFGQQQLAYRVPEALPQQVFDQFNACAGKTNIIGAPVSLPSKQ